jgi:death on curing protein
VIEPILLTMDEVFALHDDQIQRYGGSAGIRDVALLKSAVGVVAATFDGRLLHETLFEMAAAILYGICRNHPFIDGNKRTAVAAALIFLEMNGIDIKADEDDFYDLVIGVAESRVSKSAVAVFLHAQSATAGARQRARSAR